jgi:hypothetical protein
LRQLVEKVLVDFPAKLGKISKLVAQVPEFCDTDAKENPDGFLSHYLSLRILWPKRFSTVWAQGICVSFSKTAPPK